MLRFSNAAVPGREGAVDRHLADRNVVAAARHHLRGHLAHELRRIVGHQRQADPSRSSPRPERAPRAGAPARRRRPAKFLRTTSLALVAVALLDRVLDAGDRLLARQHAGDREEAGLQHGVDAAAEPHLARDLGRVDDEEAQLLVDDLLLHRARQMVPDLVRAVGAVEQEGGARRGQPQHVDAAEEARTGGRRRSWPTRSGRARGSAAGRSAGARPSARRTCASRRRSSPARTAPASSAMILTLFLLAPTVPSAPRP